MINIKKIFLIALAALPLVGGLNSLQALQVTPSYQLFSVKPGKTTKGSFLLFNDEDEDKTILMSSKDWHVIDENKSFSAEKWLKFKRKKVFMKKGSSYEAPIVLSVPKEAVGELSAMASFEVQGTKLANVKQVLSCAVYVQVEGTQRFDWSLERVFIEKSAGKWIAGIEVKNSGNIHIRPVGSMKVKSAKDESGFSVVFGRAKPAYPGQNGIFTTELLGVDVTTGTYVAVVDLRDIDRQVAVLNVTKEFVVEAAKIK